MSQHREEKRDYVFVRSRRTRQIDIRRTNEHSPRRGAYPKTQEHILHYIGLNREQICQCNIPKRHGEKVFSVAAESIHLNASLALYMTRYNIESCTAKDFQRYARGRETEWAKEGVFVNSFHYGSCEKNVVCRCTRPDDHRFGAPRNPEIIEQCAEYFCLHKDRVSVSKKEWRRVDGDSPPPYSSGVSGESQNPRKPKTRLFHDPENRRAATPISKREMKMRSNAVLLTPPFGNSCRGTAATQQEPEMPPQVWQNACSSLWARRNGVSSTATTPLGSPSSLSGPSRVPATAPLDNHIPAPTMRRPDSVSASWSQVQRNANNEDMRWGIKTASIGMRDKEAIGDKTDVSIVATETDGHVGSRPSVDEQPLQPLELHEYRLQPVAYNPCAQKIVQKEAVQKGMTPNVPMAKLSAHGFTAELPGDTPRRQHTPTLKRLEGCDRDIISGREPKAMNTIDQPEAMSTRTSCLTRNSNLFNSLLKQIQSSPVSSITDREILPTTLMSTSRVAELGIDYWERQENSKGITPTSASKEALADRINAQREAIFGSQITPLQDELCIEFPQRSDVVICNSQEDVSVAQLLLINDHVGTHAMEALHLFEAKGADPDWHMDVIQPAVMLFRGWNRSFPDLVSYMHEAFLNLMAWAELLRLMKDPQVAVGRARGGDVMLPWLEELQDRFMEAKELYDKGKEKWRIDIFEPLSCDKVALYISAEATGTRRL